MFARRSTLRLFLVLASGLVLAERGTVVAMAAAGGIAGQWRRACWFFAGAAWDADALGLAVARLIVKYLTDPGAPVVVAVDGTFFQRWGKKVFQARWAYDGSAQGGKKLAFGNTWVIAAIVVRLRFCSSPVALPVLFRLWRGKGTPSQVTLAGEMMSLLVAAFPDRKVHGTGDAAFHGGPLVMRMPRGPPGCRPRSPRRRRRGRGGGPDQGSPPVVPHDERMDVVRALGLVDEVVSDWSSDKFEMWKQLRYDVLFKGDDWKGTEKGMRLERLLGEVGARVHYFPYTASTSSTDLRRLLEGMS